MNPIVLSTEIRIEYTTQDGTLGAQRLEPLEFFDLEPEDEEPSSILELVWDKAHACEFLGLSPKVLSTTTLDVFCSITREHIRTVEAFWNDGNCRNILQRESVDGCEVRWLRIVEIGTKEGIHFVHFGSESKSESDLIRHYFVTPEDHVSELTQGVFAD